MRKGSVIMAIGVIMCACGIVIWILDDNNSTSTALIIIIGIIIGMFGLAIFVFEIMKDFDVAEPKQPFG